MLVIQSILLRYCNDSLGYIKFFINRYLCNGEMSDSEVNNIMCI